MQANQPGTCSVIPQKGCTNVNTAKFRKKQARPWKNTFSQEGLEFFLGRADDLHNGKIVKKSDPKQNTSDNRDETKNLIYNGDMRESDNFAQLDTMGNSMLSEKKIGRNESWVDDL